MAGTGHPRWDPAAKKLAEVPKRDEAGYQKGREKWAQYVDQKYTEPTFFSHAYKTLLGE